MDKLEPHLTYRICPVGKRLSFSADHQPDCYFIRKGAISLYRQPDDILLEILEAPTLRGIIPVPETSQSLFTLRVVETAEIATLDKQRFYTLLTEHSLWQPFAMHLQLVASISAEVLFKLGSPSVFELVRYQLYELISKPQTLRESITAENYIRGKTRLSRSAIMNTLSALKRGGYISIENGHLTDVKYIPSRY
ncbi:helix-turn-helix domain-containing protein [Lelliottia aquatilis]|jgi:CRP-like cAMP-binding protein|nr:helix-turn-helix domain-containing protein [Lelliottia aquatilis]